MQHSSSRTRLRRVVAFAGASVVGLLGAIVGIALGAHVRAPVGPFDTTLTLRPSLSGGTVVQVAPLGRIRLATHSGPLSLRASLDELRSVEAAQIVRNPATLRGIEDQMTADIRVGLRTLVLRALFFGALGAVAMTTLVVRRPHAVLVGLLAALVMMAGSGAAAAATWRSESLAEPEYTGLLSRAPAAIGDARQVLSRFTAYRTQLAGLILNVSRLYETASTLPSHEAADGAGMVRVLHISDVHLNPAAFDLVTQLVEQFDVDVVVDTGDLGDWGSAVESNLANRIGPLSIPYVFVRGNHDSRVTEAAVRAQPNAVVLDDRAADVAGIRFWGMGDPRFTPDKRDSDDQDVQRATIESFATQVEGQLIGQGVGVDVVALHDPAAAAQILGKVPIVLAGHAHRFKAQDKDGTLLMVQGSTGGAGLRALQQEEPTSSASILYLDKESGRLAAYDVVTVGGLGQESVKISRHVVDASDSGGDPPAARPTGE